MADLFLDSGTIVSMRGRAAPERTFAADAPGTLPDFPMVVMVNGASASASEIVAGALADNDRALVLGERSFGKGLVQSVIPLPNNAGTLKLTEAHYYLPSGRNIQREDDSPTWGVDPSDGYYVPMTGEEYGRMWRIRQQEEIRRAEPDSDRARWEDPAWIRERLEDPQLAAAVRAIGAKLATGEWLRTGEDVPEFAIEFAALKSERRRFEALQREAERTARRIQALSDLPGGDEVEASDLLPDELDLSGGLVEIRDESGAVVAQLRITGQGLERWLMEAPVEKMEPAAAAEADAEPQASGE
jgi:carboxyl-terminal processing protease